MRFLEFCINVRAGYIGFLVKRKMFSFVELEILEDYDDIKEEFEFLIFLRKKIKLMESRSEFELEIFF